MDAGVSTQAHASLMAARGPAPGLCSEEPGVPAHQLGSQGDGKSEPSPLCLSTLPWAMQMGEGPPDVGRGGTWEEDLMGT